MKYFLNSLIFILLVIVFLPKSSFAAFPAIDPTFNTGTGFDNLIHYNGVAVQPDGNIVVGGFFLNYNGTPATRIIRLTSTGAIDPTFVTGTGFNNAPMSVAVQPDGKVLVAGFFTQYNGTNVNRIIRLTSTGAIDPTFNIGTGFDSNTLFTRVLSDGKILVGGAFSTYQGISSPGLVKLNTDGSIDSTFNVGSGFSICNLGTRDAYVQNDGKIIITGCFSNYNGTSANSIIRLTSTGAIDSTFNVGTGFNSLTTKIISTTDGSYVVSGAFNNYNGTTISGIAKISKNGTIDGTFSTNANGGFDNETYGLIGFSDGRFWVGGNGYSTYGGSSVSNNITSLNLDGTLDIGTDFGLGTPSSVLGIIKQQQDGKVIIFGGFTDIDGNPLGRIVRLADVNSPVISPVEIKSSNTNQLFATTGDVITLTWVSDSISTSQVVTIAGQSVVPTCVGVNQITCSATLPVTSSIPTVDGVVPFSITSTSLGGTTGPITSTTDGSSVTVDRTIALTVLSVGGDASPAYQTVDTNPAIVISSSAGDTVTIPGFTCTPTPATGSTVTCTPTVPYAVNNSVSYVVTATISDPAGNVASGPIQFSVLSSLGGGGSVLLISSIPSTGSINPPPIKNPTQTSPSINPIQSPTFISPLDNKVYVCTPFTKYLKLNSKNNDTTEVKLWQAFLNKHMNESLPVTGFYGNLTFNAVKRFQQKYASEVLTPWGIVSPTGWTYKSTRAKGNQILGCPEGKVLLDNGVSIDLK